jgi:putative ATPase
VERRLAALAPLAEALRPRSLDEFVGQHHLVGPDGPLRAMAEGGALTSMVLWGPAGTGKTTLARIIASRAGFETETLSAVASGVKDLREVIARAEARLAERGTRTVLFIDEVHRFNKSQQDLLLPATETGLLVIIGATTENPYFEVNAALISRTTQWRLTPLTGADIVTLVDRGVRLRGASIDPEAVELIVSTSEGDARVALTTLDVAIALAGSRRGSDHVEPGDVVAARDGRARHQSADTHYDQVSALIKSIRGSDPDAALFWLIALLDAGESPRFLARRLVILASEDVGLADERGLLIAESAARAVELVGLPEARLNLAHATIALSLMDKSNSVATALSRASEAIASGASTEVPAHLRDASYRAASSIGHGVGYRYAHDSERGWVDQEYLPEHTPGRPFYVPSERDREDELTSQWRRRRGDTPQESEEPPVG